MTRDEKKRDILKLLHGYKDPICDNCIEVKLDYDKKQVNPINNEFKNNGTIKRHHEMPCSNCGKFNFVNELI